MPQQGNDNDNVWLIFAGIPILALIGPGILAKLTPAAQETLLRYHVLASQNLVLPITDTAGLDLGRLIIAAALIALIITALVLYGVARARSRRAERS